MAHKKSGLLINLGGVPTDLSAGMIEAVTNPPEGFVSKYKFAHSEVASRVQTISWFAKCGTPISLELTMGVEQIRSWPEAIHSCKDSVWENVQLEAQNQLTLWLHNHARENYRNWNNLVEAHKATVIVPLIEQQLAPFQKRHGLDNALIQSVRWDILGALMENSYMGSGHSVFFFLELLLVYEAGHFPCGWDGEWPQGKLLVY